MKTTKFVLLFGVCLAGNAFAASVPEKLAEVMEAAALHLNFESGDLSSEIGDAVPTENKNFEVIHLPEGYALFTENGKRVRFQENEALDFSRPGSIAFWVSPRGWEWGNERPYNPFFGAAWVGGSVVITRQGLLHPPGEAVRRLDRILVSLRETTESEPLTVTLGASDPERWADETWHLLVLTWNGPSWSVSLDAGERKYFNLSASIQGNANFSIGGTQERTCFKALTIFNRELSDEAIETLYRFQNPRP